MKRIALVLMACLIAILSMAQDREIKQIELKNGNKLTGYISVQQDGSYLVETAGGDVFFFTPSEVSKISKVDSTQTPIISTPFDEKKEYSLKLVNVGKQVYKKGGRLRFLETDMPIERKDFATGQGWGDYQSARNLRMAGNILWISGAGIAASGMIVAAIKWGEVQSIFYLGDGEVEAILFFGGATVAITGVVFSIIGNTKIKKIAKGINQGSGYELTFGAQPHGIGIALNF